MKKTISKKSWKILILGFLAVALLGAVSLVQKVQETRRRALEVEGWLPVSFSPASKNLQIGETGVFYIKIAQSVEKPVSNFAFKINYDPQYLELITSSADEAKGTENIVLSTFNESQAGEITTWGVPKELTKDDSLEAIKLIFKALKRGETIISINEEAALVTVCLPTLNQDTQKNVCQKWSEEQITDLAFSDASITIEEGGEVERPEITVSLNPIGGEKKLGDEFEVVFSADAGFNKIKDVEIIFNFDPEELEVVRAEVPIGENYIFDEITWNETTVNESDPSDAEYRIVAVSHDRPLDDLKSGKLLLATFTLKGLKLGQADFNLGKVDFAGYAPNGYHLEDMNPEEVDIFGPGVNEIILPSELVGSYNIVSGIVATATPTTTTAPATPTPTEIAGPSLSFQIKFGGVGSKIPDQKVNLTVKKGGGVVIKDFPNINVVADDKGVLRGEVSLAGVDLGEGYYLIIKGPKHIAERFCEDKQKGYCSQGTLTLAEDNNFDFTGWPLRPGDITGLDKVQDGVVDSTDWNFLVGALSSKATEVHKAQANLNYSIYEGKESITGLDIQIFLETMGTHYDDDY